MCISSPQIVPGPTGKLAITLCRIFAPLHLALLIMFYLGKEWFSGTQHLLMLFFALITFFPALHQGTDVCSMSMALMLYITDAIMGMVAIIYVYGGEEKINAKLRSLDADYRGMLHAAFWTQFAHGVLMFVLVSMILSNILRIWYSDERTRHHNPIFGGTRYSPLPHDFGADEPTQEQPRHNFSRSQGEAVGGQGNADVAAARAEFIRRAREAQNQGRPEPNPESQGFRVGDEI